jgi:hypothetical protein
MYCMLCLVATGEGGMPLASELLMPGRSLKLDYKMLRHGENSLQIRPGQVEGSCCPTIICLIQSVYTS